LLSVIYRLPSGPALDRAELLRSFFVRVTFGSTAILEGYGAETEMPIATLVERTIVPRMAFSFSGKGARKYGANDSKVLPFQHVHSTASRSAWAAAALSISRYYGLRTVGELGLTQDGIEDRVQHLTPRARVASQGDLFDLALKAVGHANGKPVAAAPDPAKVLAELNAGRPVAVRIEWSSGLPHYVVIYGYRVREGLLEYVVDDPIHGVLSVSDWSLMHSYLCDGRWTRSYMTR